jgi:hypothetical protein
VVPETPDDGDMEIDGAANTVSVGAITARITMMIKTQNTIDALFVNFFNIIC